jgi:hypothetical protein
MTDQDQESDPLLQEEKALEETLKNGPTYKIYKTVPIVDRSTGRVVGTRRQAKQI